MKVCSVRVLRLRQDEVKRLYEVYKANMLCDLGYKTTSQPGFCPITLFRAHEQLEVFEFLPSEIDTKKDQTWGWCDCSSNPIDLHIIPGNHFTMMREPHVQVLAEKLQTCLGSTLPSLNP